MAYPSDIDTYTPVAGTSLVTAADHANMHNAAGSAIVALENKVGSGAGSAAANQILVGSGAGQSSWGSVWNLAQLGTPTIGTPNVTGGTANAFNLGTPTITGGLTLSSNGAITQSGTADHITITPGSSKLVRTAVLRQDITSNAYVNNSGVLTGWNYLFVAGGASVGTAGVTFGGTFSSAPIVVCRG